MNKTNNFKTAEKFVQESIRMNGLSLEQACSLVDKQVLSFSNHINVNVNVSAGWVMLNIGPWIACNKDSVIYNVD